jgi:hypothetical protein
MQVAHGTERPPRGIDEAPYLDLFAPEFQADPASAIAALREQSWLVRTPIGVLAIARDMVESLLVDTRLRSSLLDFVRLQE